MKGLVVFASALLAACSLATNTAKFATSRPIVIGTEADIERAALLATKCKLEGATTGKLDGHPALFIENATVLRAAPSSPAWECFTLGLLSPEFSDQLGLLGGGAARQP